MANLVTFAKKLWKDKVGGNTPITAAELNRMEGGINDCATQINKLGDSVSQRTETVRGDYGEVTFKKNGLVYFVKSSLTINETVTANKWVTICHIPSWFIVNSYWLSTRDSSGKVTGIWCIRGSEMRVYLQTTTDKSLVVEGMMMG